MRRIERACLLLVLCGLMIAAGSPGAFAQDTLIRNGRIRRPFRIKIGGYFPADGTIRKETANRFTSLGFSYDFFAIPAASPLIAGIYINDASKTGDKRFGSVTLGTEASITGIGLQARTYFLPEKQDLNFFAGGGIGMYSIKVKTGIARGNTFVSDSKNSARLGGKVMAGVEWKKRFFGELEYTFPGFVSAGGKTFDLSGMNVSIGSRF